MTMLPQEGLSPSPSLPLAASQPPREPGAALRLMAGLRWFSLDERLAAGEDPLQSALLAAQAGRLTRRRHRDSLAAALHGLLLAAERAPGMRRVSRTAPRCCARRRLCARSHGAWSPIRRCTRVAWRDSSACSATRQDRPSAGALASSRRSWSGSTRS